MSKKGEKRLRPFEMKSYRRMLVISWKEKKTNEWVKVEITRICGQELKGFVDMVRRQQFSFLAHDERRRNVEGYS